MSFHLDSDSIEVEGMPCDMLNERAMMEGSFALHCALNAARGLAPPQRPERPRGPPITLPPISRTLVEKFVRREEQKPVAKPEPIPGEGVGRAVIRSVAEAYEIHTRDLIGPNRMRHFVCARIVASRLLRDLTWKDGTPRFSLPQLGRMMGRDHSTVIYHLKMFDTYCEQYPFMREVYDTLRGGAA